MSARAVPAATARDDPGGAAGGPLLEVEGLAVHFGGVQAVSDATFTVRSGTITGLIGPNGAGKSTVINLVSGRTRPSRGAVRFAGVDLTGRPTHEIARAGLVRTFQHANVFARLTVLENLLVGASPWRGERLVQAIWRKSSWRGAEAELAGRAYALLQRFGLEGLANEYAGALSGGQKRLVEVMRALMASPRMLLLDEPMAGVNPSLAMSIADRLEELRDEGVTMLMVEHELRLVERLCDPVVVMARGRVLAEGSMEELQRNKDVLDAYLGGDGA
ncbi:MAG TPA: ABC transporter ATP-binding protein [Acidimicrobiales bacterium]|nr:ABC transporter ATP-binding protein [Acidimicrobiales bacterium]